MATIIFTSWDRDKGARPIPFIYLLVEKGLSLKSAFDMVNRILEGHIESLELENIADALNFIEKSKKLGFNCELRDE
ncbi:MAG: hypothetical protein OEW75_00410 [Cyclobacteriaceae bacterium]|nr:hypothetical protein [Cyclobacteriaceae bacterium]